MTNSHTIAIIGGTGKAGRYIAKKALETGFNVRMLIKNPDTQVYINDKVEIIKGDAQNIDSIRSLLKDCTLVINTIGQPVKESPIYSHVTHNIISIMNECDIKRYISVTGASLNIKGDKKNLINKIGEKIFEFLFPNMMKDKKKELKLLINSNIEWTLIRLPFIIDSPETNHIKESLIDTPGTKISNTDIARFIIDEVTNQKYIRKTPFIAN